jgi:hypothetical protein
MVDISNGRLYLSSQIWDKIPGNIQRYILLHEEGHLINQTHDEGIAEQYAVKNFIDRTSLGSIAKTTSELEEIRGYAKKATPDIIDQVNRSYKNLRESKIWNNNMAAQVIEAISVIITIGVAVYGIIDSSNKQKKAKKKQKENELKADVWNLFNLDQEQEKILLYSGVGLVGMAFLVLILLRFKK